MSHCHWHEGSEPILPGYPVPWGLRMDGEALWAIRNFGWLELGFDEGYFRAALARTGWDVRKHACADMPWASVWEAWGTEAEPVTHPNPEPAPAVLAEPDAAPALQGPAAPTEREAALTRELDAVYRSTSWRATAPLRAFKRLLPRR